MNAHDGVRRALDIASHPYAASWVESNLYRQRLRDIAKHGVVIPNKSIQYCIVTPLVIPPPRPQLCVVQATCTQFCHNRVNVMGLYDAFTGSAQNKKQTKKHLNK